MQRKKGQPVSSYARGLSSIEIVLGVSLAALILIFVTYAVVRFVNTGRDVSDRAQALYLAEEGLELIRFVRDEDWSNIGSLTGNTSYYLDIDPTSISITGAPETIDYFERRFWVSNVYRNADDDIVPSTTPGSVADPESRYVTVEVTGGTPERTITLSTILANIDQ